MTEDELGQLSRERLIELLLKKFDQIEALQTSLQVLQRENEVLRKKVEKLQKPPTNSKNSSQPPSLDRKAIDRETRRANVMAWPKGTKSTSVCLWNIQTTWSI